MSLFDLAAAAAPVDQLDEHFRSRPHLIGFSARRFYGGALALATLHPRNDDADCISVRHVEGKRRSDGVNPAEIDAVLETILEHRQLGRASGDLPSIGVITPFREHADAIEARLIEQFTLEELDELDLRAGTVHSFQGCERDLMIISLALDDESPAASRAFVADANLFNVMVTRARREIVVITSLTDHPKGVIGDFLRHGDQPPLPPQRSGGEHRLAAPIAEDLRRLGVPVTTGYRSGHHLIDLMLGDGDDAFGVLIGVHPSGPDAHIERHLTLERAGWKLFERFETRCADRLPELVVELANEWEHGRQPQ
jgi:hypothetical protein